MVGGGIVGFGVVFLALVRYGTGTVRSFEAGLTSRAARRPEA